MITFIYYTLIAILTIWAFRWGRRTGLEKNEQKRSGLDQYWKEVREAEDRRKLREG